jgi:hypothetical protein
MRGRWTDRGLPRCGRDVRRVVDVIAESSCWRSVAVAQPGCAAGSQRGCPLAGMVPPVTPVHLLYAHMTGRLTSMTNETLPGRTVARADAASLLTRAP